MEVTKVVQEAYADVRAFNDIAGNLDNVTADSIDNQISFIFEELSETIAGFEAGDSIEVLDGACDLFVTVAGLMQKLEAKGYDVATALARVNANNLSKFPKFIAAEDMRDGYTVAVNKLHGRYVIKDNNGKVRKPTSFQAVDLSDLVPSKGGV